MRTQSWIVGGWGVVLVVAILLAGGLFWQNRRDAKPKTVAAPASDASPFAAWRPVGVRVESGAAVAPDGQKTAARLSETEHGGVHTLFATLNLDASKPQSASLYAQAGHERRLLFFFVDGGELIVSCDVDLKTGAATMKASGPPESAGCNTARARNNWWRVDLRGSFDPASQKSKALGIAPTVEPFERSYVSNGQGNILIWNAAVPASPLDPRLDPSEFAAWHAMGVRLQSDAAIDPAGKRTGTKLIEDLTAGLHTLTASINIDGTKPVTATVHAQPGLGRRLLFFLADDGEPEPVVSCDVDLKTGAATVRAQKRRESSSCTTSRGLNGWWRVDLVGAFDPSSQKAKRFGIAPTVQPFERAYAGNGQGNIMIWNATVSQ